MHVPCLSRSSPGRLEIQLLVPPPDAEARAQILAIHSRRTPTAADVDLGALAALTDGYTGAELRAVCQEACLGALRESIDCLQVHQSHFLKVSAGPQPRHAGSQPAQPLSAPPSLHAAVAHRHCHRMGTHVSANRRLGGLLSTTLSWTAWGRGLPGAGPGATAAQSEIGCRSSRITRRSRRRCAWPHLEHAPQRSQAGAGCPISQAATGSRRRPSRASQPLRAPVATVSFKESLLIKTGRTSGMCLKLKLAVRYLNVQFHHLRCKFSHLFRNLQHFRGLHGRVEHEIAYALATRVHEFEQAHATTAQAARAYVHVNS